MGMTCASVPHPAHPLVAAWPGEHEAYASTDVDHARDHLSRALNEHRLNPTAGRFEMTLRRAELPSVTACLLRYGSAVEIEAESLERFVLVQIPLSGAIQVRCGALALTATPQAGLVLPSRRPLRLSWPQDCTQLLLKIPSERVDAVCSAFLGRAPIEPVEFRNDVPLQGMADAGWMPLLNLLLSQSTVWRADAARTRLARQVEDALIGHLLCHQPHNHSVRLVAGREPLAPRHVRAAEEYMQANLHRPITLADMAAHAGVSVRSLSRAFQDCRGTSPMALLRSARLDRVRQELSQCGSGASVTAVALKWGFMHLGRFAAAYRARFGEAPSETLKK